MMCNSATRGFRTQLAMIWEKLTKAALVEISNIADECSAVLHTEISLHKTENEALKKRCYSLEVQLRAAREAREAHSYPGHGSSMAHRLSADQPHHSPEIEGVFGKDWCMELWRDDKALPREKGNVDAAAMTSLQAQTIDLIESDPELIFVKEESYDDHPIGHGHHMPLTETPTGAGIFENNMLHRSVEQQLQSELNNFQLMTESHSTSQQCTQAPLSSEHLLDEATINTIVSSNDIPTVSSYNHNIDMNTGKDEAFQPRVIKPTKRFECLFCGRIFNYLSSLKVHIRRHSGEKPFNCTVCGKRFAQKTYLKLHQRVHSGERPYSCPDCGKSFSQKSSLNIHLRTHTGERPYSCVDCGKSYTYKYGLNHHQCIHSHPEGYDLSVKPSQ